MRPRRREPWTLRWVAATLGVDLGLELVGEAPAAPVRPAPAPRPHRRGSQDALLPGLPLYSWARHPHHLCSWVMPATFFRAWRLKRTSDAHCALPGLQPPALPLPCSLSSRQRNPPWKPNCRAGVGSVRWPLPGNNFQRILQSRVSMGTRAGCTGNPTFTASIEAPWQGAGCSARTATASWHQPSLT